MDTFAYYEIECNVLWDTENQKDLRHNVGANISPAQALELAIEFGWSPNPKNPQRLVWSLWGRNADGEGYHLGDHRSFEDAYEVLCMILAPIRAAADCIAETTESDVGLMLEDICNQSTTEERL